MDLYPPALSPPKDSANEEKGSHGQLGMVVSLSSGEGLRERSGEVIVINPANIEKYATTYGVVNVFGDILSTNI